MADSNYNLAAVYLPYQVAKVRLPLGLPAGVAARNTIAEDFKQQILKHLPIMRSYGLTDAADYMESWVLGTMPLEPLLEVRATLCCYYRLALMKPFARC